MCGLVGLVGHSQVNQRLYDALTVLQHRGQDAAGIVTDDAGRLYMRKSTGLVRDVFHSRHMRDLKGVVGIGHVRYPTAGGLNSAEAQPFYVNSPYGIAFAHNGNLVNSESLRKSLFEQGFRHINTDSDSEILLNVFAHELQSGGHLKLEVKDVFRAVRAVNELCVGGYSGVALIVGFGIVAFRDPHGIRPLVVGRRKTENGDEYMVASESVALDILGFELVGDVAPGEAVVIEQSGAFHRSSCADNVSLMPCLFEYVYLARPDSILDGISVYKTHIRMGQRLAAKILREWDVKDIDVVIPIPDTGRCVALEVASALGVNYREGFVKNRYIGRTFIMPGQKMRKRSVRQKLNLIGLEFKGKNVLLVDDSIVRGTTCQQIIQMARQAGAKKVYFASAAPPVRFPNVYGIDMPVAEEFIAHERTVEQISEAIGADALIYQDLEDLLAAAREGNDAVDGFEASVFDGVYVTGGLDEDYFKRLSASRSDEAKRVSENEGDVLGLHNSG